MSCSIFTDFTHILFPSFPHLHHWRVCVFSQIASHFFSEAHHVVFSSHYELHNLNWGLDFSCVYSLRCELSIAWIHRLTAAIKMDWRRTQTLERLDSTHFNELSVEKFTCCVQRPNVISRIWSFRSCSCLHLDRPASNARSTAFFL